MIVITGDRDCAAIRRVVAKHEAETRWARHPSTDFPLGSLELLRRERAVCEAILAMGDREAA